MTSSDRPTTANASPTLHDDLYQILNVQHNAIFTDLKASYRRLSQRFHPDKHVDPDAKSIATDHFTRVKEAFEILSNQKLRRLYDEFGLDAARSAAMPEMELVPYDDLAERFRTDTWSGRKASGQGGPESSRDAYFTVSNSLESRFDATGLVIALEDGLTSKSFASYQPLAAISQVSLSSMATAYVTQQDTVSIRYSLSGHGGRSHADSGVGDAAVTWRRQIDPHMHVEAAVQAPLEEGTSALYSLKAFRTLSEDMSMSWEATLDPERGDVTTGLSAARSLDERNSASVSWAMGARSGFAFTWARSAYDEYVTEAKSGDMFEGSDDEVERRREDGLLRWLWQKADRLIEPVGLRWTARWSAFDASLGCSVRRPLGEHAPLWNKCEPTGPGGAHVKASALVGLMGWEAKVGVSRRFMMSDTEAGTSLAIGTMGIIWRLRVRRGAHRFTVPVVLQSGFVDAKTATVAAIAASALLTVVECLVLQPWNAWRDGIERAEAREQREDVLKQGKEEAEAAVKLMAVQVERSREAEAKVDVDGEQVSGLLIERALYGVRRNVKKMRLSDDTVVDREIEVEMVDVTIAMQALVDKSVVQLVSATKSTLLGFWDPSAYGDKDELVLRVWYYFGGEKHECLLKDDDAIELPLSSHRVSNWT